MTRFPSNGHWFAERSGPWLGGGTGEDAPTPANGGPVNEPSSELFLKGGGKKNTTANTKKKSAKKETELEMTPRKKKKKKNL